MQQVVGMKYMPLGEHLCYVWVQQCTLQAFRTGSNIRFITVFREIAHAMDTACLAPLPRMHWVWYSGRWNIRYHLRITVCSEVTDVSTVCSEATDVIQELSTTHISEKSESCIERFVILMYDGKSYLDEINAAKKGMFTN